MGNGNTVDGRQTTVHRRSFRVEKSSKEGAGYGIQSGMTLYFSAFSALLRFWQWPRTAFSCEVVIQSTVHRRQSTDGRLWLKSHHRKGAGYGIQSGMTLYFSALFVSLRFWQWPRTAFSCEVVYCRFQRHNEMRTGPLNEASGPRLYLASVSG